MQHHFYFFAVYIYLLSSLRSNLASLDFSYQADKPFFLEAREFRLPQFKRDKSKAIQTDKGAILLFYINQE